MNNLINNKLIKDFIKKNKLTKKAFSNLAGIRLKDLNKIFKYNYNVDINVLFKIAKVMKIEVYQIFI